jgi:DNA (cytosine-5)-methyltransferase 1
LIAHTLRASGCDASEDGTGRGTPLVPVAAPLSAGNNANSNAAGRRREDDENLIAFDTTQITSPTNRSQPDDRSPKLSASAHAPAIAFHARQDPDSGSVTHPLDTDGTSIAISSGVAVRRLTPIEAERLQGFPDDFTAIPFRGAPAKDTPRYKALGNSMATPVVRWLGERIELVESALDCAGKHRLSGAYK